MLKRRSITGHGTCGGRLLCLALLLAWAQMVYAQQSILGTNLIANGNAEAGPAGTATSVATAIPSWTRVSGNANVLPYGLTNHLLLSEPAPPDHGFQYFSVPPNNAASILTQTFDVSSGASAIGSGNVKYTASAYLGYSTSEATVAFQNANGQTFSVATLGPIRYNVAGMYLQQRIGLVPSGTVRVVVTLTLNAFATADSLSLVFNMLITSPVLGTNLVVNGGAEAGPSIPAPAHALYIPGWSTDTVPASVAPYGGKDWIATSDPGPADRGVSLFCGAGDMYQDIDVSPSAALIDAGKVTFQVAAWLGGQGASPTLTYTFFDWPGKQLAPTAQLGPVSHSGTGLLETSHSDALPSGTRRVHLALSFPVYWMMADNISFTLSAAVPPAITSALSAGAFGGFTSIAPGSWIEVYGTNLASTTQGWSGSDFNNGVAPTSLAGVSVSIGGKAAFIDYVSPSQINALVPSDVPTGMASLTVTNSNGTSNSVALTVNSTQPGLLAPPSFQIGGKQYLAALFPDGSFALPQNAISGVPSRPAKPGDLLVVYGVGFGPVSPGVTAGTVVTQANSLTTPVQFLFGATPVTSSYAGLAPSFTGLYQFNIVVPNVTANNAAPISFSLGGTMGSQTLYIAVQN